MPLIVLPDTAHDAATNMAIDASLLNSAPKKSAVFRHYNWTEPTITFGYTQRINEIRTVAPDNLRLCRRITGGGIVDHRNDWTYALILQFHLKAAQIPATELYKMIHHCIQQALATQSIKTQLAPCPRACGQTPAKPPTGPSQCFVLPAANDVLHPDGKKIAGAAMKRTRQGLLIQGSINRSALPETFDYKELSNTLPERIADRLNLNLSKDTDHLPDQQHIQQERQRFESADWTNKR